MRHEDVSKKSTLAGLNRTLDEWLCDSFVERAVGQQTGISAYHWKTELGCSN